MAVTTTVYGKAGMAFAAKQVDWVVDPVKMMLLADTYTFDKDAHALIGDVQSHQITGTGYTAGGVGVQSRDVVYDAATDETWLRGTGILWSTATLTARYAVVYVDGTVKPLLACVDLGAPVSVTSGNLSMTFPSNVIVRMGAL